MADAPFPSVMLEADRSTPARRAVLVAWILGSVAEDDGRWEAVLLDGKR
ncbi:hypothetical protein SAMN05880582_10178 [Rhizobium sp. RU20A]|nr:hypothetical protein SAMN05880582_10178 [Rhizobium sp. RU20A]